MAKNESLVPDGELERLKQLDVEIMNAANSMEKMLAKIQMYATAFSKTNVPYKEFLEITKEFNAVCDESKKKTEDLNKAAKEQEEIRKKTIESTSKEVEAIKQVNEAYSVQSKTLKDISKEGYNLAEKGISSLSKELWAAQKKVESMNNTLKLTKKAYKDGRIGLEEYNDRVRRLNDSKKEAQAVVKQLSRELDLNKKIVRTNTGSYDNLSAQYSKLKIQINQMSEAERFNGYTKKELESHAKALYEQMSNLQKATGKSQLDVGKYDKAVGDLTTTLRMLDPSLGMIVGRIQQITPLKKAWITTNEKLQKSMNVTARTATIMQGAVVGLVVAGILLAVDAYKKWNKEQEEAKEKQQKFNSEVSSSSASLIVKYKELQTQWLSLTDDLDTRTKFIKENKTEFDNLGISVKNVNDADNLFVKNTDAFIQALTLRTEATIHSKLAEESMTEAIKKQREADTATISFWSRLKGAMAYSGLAQEGLLDEGSSVNSMIQEFHDKDVADMRSTEADFRKEAEDHMKAKFEALKKASEILKAAGIDDVTDDGPTTDSKKQKETELKASQDLIEHKMQQEADAQKKLLEDNKRSYDERMMAANDFEERMGALIEQKRKHQLSQEGLTASQIILINEKADAELSKISEEGGKLRENIWKDHIAKRNKDIEQGLERLNQILNDNEQQERRRLLQELQSGKISKEEYEQQMTDLTVTYSQSRLQAEIDAIQKMLDVVGISEEERLALTQKLRKAELDFNKSILDQQVKDEFDAAKKREEIEKKLADTKKKLGQEVYNFLGSLASSYTERQLNELETQQEQNDEWRDLEIQRIEDQEQKGVISKEQAEAQKWAIDEQSKQNDKKIEEEKKKVLERQAKFEKAASLVKVAMDTAKGVTAAMALMPLTAGQPFVSMILAMGALQTAAIMAQPVPKYKQGTDDHRGGLAIVGDGGKHEMVVLPSGEIWKTPKTDTLVDLPKGTQVLPDFSKALVNMSVLRANEEEKTIVVQEHKGIVDTMSKNNRLLKNMVVSQNHIARELVKKNSNPFNLER